MMMRGKVFLTDKELNVCFVEQQSLLERASRGRLKRCVVRPTPAVAGGIRTRWCYGAPRLPEANVASIWFTSYSPVLLVY